MQVVRDFRKLLVRKGPNIKARWAENKFDLNNQTVNAVGYLTTRMRGKS